ncbi:type III pantothenate kinase [Oribacterium sp. WCC10]|uniref:type III pantothenate kinase n=1 Tax=Oribacterium sp. WCC10 TaxID=1855343 RepID=UPI0008ED4854|nr:type III pantothenate kinase [Oribacterium sp. WCC10]SFG31925.1 type III pantothenate kinase [Oribacterium sp. WCC10]
MILAVDCGNTHTKIGCIDEGIVIEPVVRLETNRKKTMYEYASDIDRILSLTHLKEKNIDGVIISCVVPPLMDVLYDALKLVTGKNALMVGAGVKSGIRIQIDDPGTIAANLVSAAVGAKNLYSLPAIIVNMGTATTVTVVNAEGAYIGGIIMPGVTLSMDALTSGTSLLPSVDLAPPKKTISTQTMDAMKAGIIYGSAGALDGIIDRFTAELKIENPSIIATGGIAHVITKYTKHKMILDENLLLKGLWYIWCLNQNKRKK